MEIITIGIDLAKNVFQVHGVDDAGKIVVRRALRRKEMLGFFGKLAPCLVGMEACATAHHWARELARLGHEVRLMPPAYVKPYVKRNKNDTADAEPEFQREVQHPLADVGSAWFPDLSGVLPCHATSIFRPPKESGLPFSSRPVIRRRA